MSTYELFLSINEPFAAGLFEFENESPEIRYANALKRFWELAPIPDYDGGELYPSGINIFNFDLSIAFRPHYANTYIYDGWRLAEKSEEANKKVWNEVTKVAGFMGWPHFVGGAGWTHSFPNYERILSEGLDSYKERVLLMKNEDLKKGLLITLEGIEIYRNRCVSLLEKSGAPEKLINALKKVPNAPAENMYEALVAWNFIYYIDGCDDIGALDRNLLPYYDKEDVTHLIRELFTHVDINDGWSGPLGPKYNEITLMCLKAIHGLRRPSLQLLVTKDMPKEIWDAASAAIATGCGQPALYNYELYIENMKKRMPEVSDKDLNKLCFGGCTETMIEGLSAIGSDDAGINVALAFCDYMNLSLAKAKDYSSFFDGFKIYLEDIINKTIDILNEHRRTRALDRPAMVRSLLIDDCIEKELEYNNGGARYMWSLINVAGVVNVIESLFVIRKLVFEDKTYSAEDFIEKLNSNDTELCLRAKKCPAYGNGIEDVDIIGAEILEAVNSIFEKRTCFPRGKFFMVSNQFSTYVDSGRGVGATPDGRACGAPLCDSLGAQNGKDVMGPPALLSSASTINPSLVIGSPITNMRMAKEHVHSMLAPLVVSYFEKGGMQLQISCLSREDMLDAMNHPEKHQNLIVRIGGFSEYFIRLSRELQETVLKRTEY